MRLFLLITLFFQFTAQIISQTPQVTWGPELQKPRKTDVSKLIGCDKTSFYCIRDVYSIFSANQKMLEKYSIKTMKLEYVREMRLPEINGHKLKYDDIYILNGKILLFSSAYFSEQDKKIAYVQKLNAEDGSLIGQPKEIDYIVAEKKRNSGDFTFVLSEDSTKILIAANAPYDKYSNEKFSYKMINSNAEILWQASLELPYKDKYFKISNYKIDESGDVYMLASVTKEKEDRERKKPDYIYNIVKYNPSTKVTSEIPISFSDKYISDIGFASASKEKLAVGGFYSNKNALGLAGTFYMSVDKATNKITSVGTRDFTTEFLGEFMSARRAGKHKELYDFSIDHFITQSDGGLIMVAEQYYVNVVTVCNPKGGCTTTYYYHYHGIIVASFNKDASLNWIKHIPKYQMSTNDGGYNSSYSFVLTDNKFHFIYNDHPKNLDPERNPKSYRNGISRKMVTVDVAMNPEDGSFTKTALFSAKEERIYTRPKIATQLTKDMSLFYAIKRKKFKFGIVKY